MNILTNKTRARVQKSNPMFLVLISRVFGLDDDKKWLRDTKYGKHTREIEPAVEGEGKWRREREENRSDSNRKAEGKELDMKIRKMIRGHDVSIIHMSTRNIHRGIEMKKKKTVASAAYAEISFFIVVTDHFRV